MLLTFVRSRYPLARWEKEDNSNLRFTAGWEEFSAMRQDCGIAESDIPADWRPMIDQRLEQILGNTRKTVTVRGWQISDPVPRVYDGFFQSCDLSNICGSCISDGVGSLRNFVLLHDVNVPDLYFTAPSHFRSNICAGTQPLRWFRHYRELDGDSDPYTKDEEEGISQRAILNNSPSPDIIFDDASVEVMRLDGMLFSLHDRNISCELKAWFGDDTYRIFNVSAWARAIAEQCVKHISSTISRNPECLPLLGIFAYLGRVEYGLRKTTMDHHFVQHRTETGQHVFEHRLIPVTIERGATVTFRGRQQVRKTEKFDDFIKCVCSDMFFKSEQYAGQSEWRLVVIPIIGGVIDGAFHSGLLFNLRNSETCFMANELSTSAIQLLTASETTGIFRCGS